MKVSPSILTCDFAHAADEVRFVADSGADMVHLDVMDGVFVPNLSFGPPVIAALRPHTDLFFDVHLMMQYPDRLIEAFAKAGADSLNIHLECDSPIEETLRRIRALGKQAAVTLKPNTPADAAFPYLELVDMILVMTVEPGFGGQKFMADQMDKIKQLREWLDDVNPDCLLEVDGGVDAKMHQVCKDAGANVLVAGSAYFKAEDRAAFVKLVQQ